MDTTYTRSKEQVKKRVEYNIRNYTPGVCLNITYKPLHYTVNTKAKYLKDKNKNKKDNEK
jgi:hypothetical protein